MPISEQLHKHRCLVRQLLKYRHEWGLKEYREWINSDRRRDLKLRTESDFVVQWRLGNRGDWGVWM